MRLKVVSSAARKCWHLHIFYNVLTKTLRVEIFDLERGKLLWRTCTGAYTCSSWSTAVVVSVDVEDGGGVVGDSFAWKPVVC